MRPASIVCVAAFLLSPPALAQEIVLVPPVDGGLARHFERPETRWGPGHRGIDYAVESGASVRAAADGMVSFAGPVAGRLAITIDHGDGIETTYSELGDIDAAAGIHVYEGQWIATAGRAHAGTSGLHFGLKVHGSYVDPEAFLGPVDTSGAIHLAPLAWSLPPSLPTAFTSPIHPGAGDHEQRCMNVTVQADPSAPNANIAIAVAGLSSKTKGGIAADMYEYGPELLGYPKDRIYRFSYRGLRGPRLHEPYARTDTFGDLRHASYRLERLLEQVALRHPAAAVDLIAHSQGGLLARYLLMRGTAYNSHLPHIEHLVTFSTPHEGVPLAGAIADLKSESLTGGAVLEAASDWARSGGPLPDPYSIAVGQLAPGSGFLKELTREDILFGTRALSIGILNDLVVPPDHVEMPHEVSRVVGPTGWNGHAGILRSMHARALARAFLRDAPHSCEGSADSWAGPIGAVGGFAESKLGSAYAALEKAAVGRVARAIP